MYGRNHGSLCESSEPVLCAFTRLYWQDARAPSIFSLSLSQHALHVSLGKVTGSTLDVAFGINYRSCCRKIDRDRVR